MDYEAVMAMLVQKCQEEAGSPFMAAIFDEGLGEILATGRNASRIVKTRHGEMEAIAEGVRRGISNWSDLTLVTTAEPCCMCQGAILWTGFKRVVYGTSITKLSELGWRQIQLSAAAVTSEAPFASCDIVGGVLRSQCDQLFVRQA